MLGGIGGRGERKWIIALEANETGLADRKSRGLSVSTIELADEHGGSRRYLVLECEEVAGHAWFDLIGADLATMIVSQAPAQVVARVLAKWRRFWGQPLKDLLTREAQIGLFAELWFLSRWLYPAAGPETAVIRWRGPLGARRDFEWPGNAVEVKGSTLVRGPVFRIHGLDQLDPPCVDGTLLFFAIRLREDGGGDHTLPSLVQECTTRFEPDATALSLFETKLADAGYSPLHEADYAATRWRLVDERLYPVGKDFPRLGSENFPHGLPGGISELAYSLDLSGYTGMAFCDLAAAADLLK